MKSASNVNSASKKRYLAFPMVYALIGTLLFASAGTFRWPQGWIYLGVYILMTTVSLIVVSRRNPEVIQARLSKHEGVKPWDRKLTAGIRICSLAIPLAAGLEARFDGPGTLLPVTVVPGALVMLSAAVLSARAMLVNPHFETMVRIQTDRNHSVVTEGPYAMVRHPGYLAAMLMSVAAPLVLGSVWALAPAALVIGLFRIRIAREDRALFEELPGYREYVERVPYRLVPRVW